MDTETKRVLNKLKRHENPTIAALAKKVIEKEDFNDIAQLASAIMFEYWNRRVFHGLTKPDELNTIGYNTIKQGFNNLVAMDNETIVLALKHG